MRKHQEILICQLFPPKRKVFSQFLSVLALFINHLQIIEVFSNFPWILGYHFQGMLLKLNFFAFSIIFLLFFLGTNLSDSEIFEFMLIEITGLPWFAENSNANKLLFYFFFKFNFIKVFGGCKSRIFWFQIPWIVNFPVSSEKRFRK